jgi:bifunctional ADP-heptose synthase (sugar kinase/adenylyltransferase)
MNLEAILRAFESQRALVVGDICLDRWCRYDPALSDPSRETGIPRIAVVGGESTPGAGGTIANNLIALGTGEVAVLGVLGDDGHAWELRRAMSARGIRHELVLLSL